MNIRNLLWVLGFAVIIVGCQKDEIQNENKVDSKSVLKYAANVPNEANVNAVLFMLESAGVYNDIFYSNVSYKGGEKAHEFSVNWDGNVLEQDGNKIVELNVYHLTDDDNGLANVSDSIILNMNELQIPKALKEQPTLIYKVINSLKPENYFLIPAWPNSNDDFDHEMQTNTMELIIKNAECSDFGEWADNWLEYESADSVVFFIPIRIEETISYEPVLNDKVEVEFIYDNISALEGVGDCEFIQSHAYTHAIEIKNIKRINN